MMNIKIVRRLYPEETERELYDIYYDVGLFSPLIKKWKIGESALTREDVIKYLGRQIVNAAEIKFM